VPSTVEEVFAGAGLRPGGVVAWGAPVQQTLAGVYIVAMDARIDGLDGAQSSCPLDPERLEGLLRLRPALQIDGRPPSAEELGARLASFWLPDETVLYIGLAGRSLRGRVGQYYGTRLGARRPHAGGWWVKTLDEGLELAVHWARTDNHRGDEKEMLRTFAASVSANGRAGLPDKEQVAPFANLRDGKDRVKRHHIRGATGETTSPPRP